MWYIIFFYNGKAYGSSSYRDVVTAGLDYADYCKRGIFGESYVLCQEADYTRLRGLE